jgi:hypothetical protein
MRLQPRAPGLRDLDLNLDDPEAVPEKNRIVQWLRRCFPSLDCTEQVRLGKKLPRRFDHEGPVIYLDTSAVRGSRLCPEPRATPANSGAPGLDGYQCVTPANPGQRLNSRDDDAELLWNSGRRFMRYCRIGNDPGGWFREAGT